MYCMKFISIQSLLLLVAEVEPNADSFILRNLHPYSNYSVKIRAINSENKASEDSDAVFQSTLPGGKWIQHTHFAIYSILCSMILSMSRSCVNICIIAVRRITSKFR